MELALILGKQLASMFLMIAIGFLMVKVKLLKASDSRQISVIILYVIAPCMIFSSYQISFSPEILQGLLFALLCALGVHLLYFLVTALLRKPLHLSNTERMSVIYVNAGNLIIPLVSASLGGEWVVYTTAYIVVITPLLWTHCFSVVKGERVLGLKQIFTNVNIIAIFIGLLFFIMNWRLPEILGNTVSTLGSMIAPMSMLMIGVMMAGCDLRALFSRKKAYLICLMRLLVYPLLVLLVMKLTGAAHWLPLGKQIMLVCFLSACAPSAANITQFAQFFDHDAGYAGTLNILTCLFCSVTIPLMAYLYQLLI